MRMRGAEGGAPASARAAAVCRLRRLILHGPTPTERSHAHTAAATAPPTLTLASEPRVQGASLERRPCLAARALSQMLCDEPNAARARATVLRAHIYWV